MIKQIWEKLSIRINSDRHQNQLINMLERDKKVRGVHVDSGRVHYEQKTWEEMELCSEE